MSAPRRGEIEEIERILAEHWAAKQEGMRAADICDRLQIDPRAPDAAKLRAALNHGENFACIQDAGSLRWFLRANSPVKLDFTRAEMVVRLRRNRGATKVFCRKLRSLGGSATRNRSDKSLLAQTTDAEWRIAWAKMAYLIDENDSGDRSEALEDMADVAEADEGADPFAERGESAEKGDDEDTWTFDISRDNAAGLLATGVGRGRDWFAAVDWVADNLDVRTATPEQAPNNLAWAMLVDARRSKKHRTDFLNRIVPDAAAKRSKKDDADKRFTDDQRTQFRLIDIVEQEMETIRTGAA